MGELHFLEGNGKWVVDEDLDVRLDMPRAEVGQSADVYVTYLRAEDILAIAAEIERRKAER